jgi:hypothetical protein
MNKKIILIGFLVFLGIGTFFLPQVIASENTIIVRAPRDGDSLILNSTYTIKWDTPFGFDHIKIFLYNINLTHIKTLDIFAPNTGEFEWFINAKNFLPGNNYRLKIVGAGDDNYYGYSGFFSIRAPTSLNDELVFTIGTTIVIIIIVIVFVIMHDYKNNRKIRNFIRKIRKKNKYTSVRI